MLKLQDSEPGLQLNGRGPEAQGSKAEGLDIYAIVRLSRLHPSSPDSIPIQSSHLAPGQVFGSEPPYGTHND